MTKIEQWQEWSKQYNEIGRLISQSELDFEYDIYDRTQKGTINYHSISDTIFISDGGKHNNHTLELSVSGGRELLKVLKELYE